MSGWNEFDSSIPKDRRLLLITQPDKFDAADDYYDVVVGYWNDKSKAFVPADSPASKVTGATLRVFKWQNFPKPNCRCDH
jgi:hypothetical protein